MLDPHSGSEYGAARIAAMIAATITIILTGLVSFGFMVPYAQADSFGTLPINAVWNRDAASPKSLAGDTYAIVRVATVTTNNDGSVSSYKTVGDFSGLTADWERPDIMNITMLPRSSLRTRRKTSCTSIPAPLT